MIVILRGHIRVSFSDDRLYLLIKELSQTNDKLSIYIHTWNVIQSTLSWRSINEDTTLITDEFIYNYFKDLKSFIKLIIIDDDKNIELIGRVDGTVLCNNICPLKGWKFMWYSKFKIIKHILIHEKDKKEVVVNIRFDVFNNSNILDYNRVLNFINETKNNEFKRNYFLSEKPFTGVDNIYMGVMDTMDTLISNLHTNLDNIMEKFKFLNFQYQEYYVYYENSLIDNFNLNVYKLMNGFKDWSDNDTLLHWFNQGQFETRYYKLPDNFNFSAYRILNNFIEWNNEQIIWHWFNHGYFEGRPYKLPDDFN